MQLAPTSLLKSVRIVLLENGKHALLPVRYDPHSDAASPIAVNTEVLGASQLGTVTLVRVTKRMGVVTLLDTFWQRLWIFTCRPSVCNSNAKQALL